MAVFCIRKTAEAGAPGDGSVGLTTPHQTLETRSVTGGSANMAFTGDCPPSAGDSGRTSAVTQLFPSNITLAVLVAKSQSATGAAVSELVGVLAAGGGEVGSFSGGTGVAEACEDDACEGGKHAFAPFRAFSTRCRFWSLRRASSTMLVLASAMLSQTSGVSRRWTVSSAARITPRSFFLETPALASSIS